MENVSVWFSPKGWQVSEAEAPLQATIHHY